MRDFKDYFSEREIVRYLANKRAKAAKDIHDHQFLRNISRNARKPFNPKKKKKIYKYLPPRNHWIRFKRKERKQYSNANTLNASQIERTVWKIHKKVMNGDTEEPEWHMNLFLLIEEIRKKALSYGSKKKINSPNLIPVEKDKNENSFRLICHFEDLIDQLLISQSSKYLTAVFDPLFEDCSYAFRSKKEKGYTHHLAVRDIIEFKSNYKYKRLYAAECDIQKFYDSINHSIINRSINELIHRLGKQGIKVDDRAINIFNSYLNCFAFNIDVYPKEKEILRKHKINEGTIPWLDTKDLKCVGTDIDKDRVGIPQGGALSCLIANIVLDYADKRVLDLNLRSLFYARFCDDIIILHPQKKQCRKAYNRYLKCLQELKLVIHPPKSFDKYNSLFWEIKTKEPYVWNSLNRKHRLAKKNVPWLAFVGYQIRYDGIIRVRPSSIRKELKKQVEEANKVIKNLPDKHAKRIKSRNIIFRFSQRLIAMSVGRVNANVQSMCWASGFNVLKENPARNWQLRRLDQNRNLQISRIREHLSKFEKKEFDEDGASKKNIRYRKYYGAPYSYYYQFFPRKNEKD